ncbi:MAG: endonuclease I [Planctomycetota bacterium]|jgi:endonuclease I
MRAAHLFGLTLLGVASAVAVDPPFGYYSSVDTTSQSALRSTLHAVIDDHTRFPYTSSATDTWNVLEAAQEDPSDPARIIDIYRNASYLKVSGGNTLYQREHSWPKSYGFPDDGADNMPYSDCHLLFLCNGTYNGNRSNKPFAFCGGGCTELPTDLNNGQGGGTGTYPGNSNWTTAGIFEVSPFRRGDLARAMLYADVRYEGGNHGVTGVMEPDLILTDNLGLIAGSNTGQNESFGYMGRLAVLLEWHAADPVDDFERNRNDVVGAFQGNRNPFVDRPEWVTCLFLGMCEPGEVYCSPAVTNSTGVPGLIEGRGSVSLMNNDLRLLASQLPMNSAGYFIASQTAGFVPQPSGSVGNLCVAGSIGRVVGGQILSSGFFGGFATAVDANALPQPTGPVVALSGETWHFQAWYRDAIGGQATSNFTDGWKVTWQ